MGKREVKIDYKRLKIKAKQIAENTPTKHSRPGYVEQRVIGKEERN